MSRVVFSDRTGRDAEASGLEFVVQLNVEQMNLSQMGLLRNVLK